MTDGTLATRKSGGDAVGTRASDPEATSVATLPSIEPTASEKPTELKPALTAVEPSKRGAASERSQGGGWFRRLVPAKRGSGQRMARIRTASGLAWNLSCAVLAIAIAFGAGIASARVAVEVDNPLGEVALGPWRSVPLAGLSSADPYTRARLSLTGDLPLGLAEGLAFVAKTDSTGKPLSGNCSYAIEGRMPPARWWTLHAVPREDAADRPGALHSRSVVRERGGEMRIDAAPEVRPGNWLALDGDAETLTLHVTLYDTTVTRETTLGSVSMPPILRLGCRNGTEART